MDSGELDVCSGTPSFIGLFQHPERKVKLNIHSVGVIHIRATDLSPGSTALSVICSTIVSDSFISLTVAYATIQVDFRKWRIIPTHDLLAHESILPTRSLCWVVDRSNDGHAWSCLDERRLSRRPSEFISVYCCHSLSQLRFIRIRHTDRNSCKNSQFVLRELDLFGTVTYHRDAPMALSTAGFG
jgi:hypothetical protein